MTVVNNRRIAKNTLLLYFKMLFTMAVSLYTSRVVLNTLGIEDFGLYNVIGGIVVLLSFLNSSMTGATQRYINIELGRGGMESVRQVFYTAIILHACIAIVVLLVAETLGIWFLNNMMVIPDDRLIAANWVFQFSVLSFLISIISVPYNAMIIAQERMSAFAYISVLEVVLKLIVVFLLILISSDKLILYAFLICLVSIIIRLVYGVYCKKTFSECRTSGQKINRPLFKSMLSFSSWSMVGSLGYISHNQGAAILINLFFGPAVNAAQGIANQVNTVVSGFVSNFLQALNPQIVKSYAVNDRHNLLKLVIRGCKFSFFLVILFAIPLIIEAPFVLKLWLKNVPEYTIIFVRVVLIILVFNSFTGLLSTVQGATGKVKKYQTVLTAIGLTHIPLSYLFFYKGYSPEYDKYIYLIIVMILQIIRIEFVCKSIGLSRNRFYKEVAFTCFLVAGASLFIPIVMAYLLPETMPYKFLVIALSFISVSASIFFIGLQRPERILILEKANTILGKFRN